ncbi:MAG: M20 family metallopeptidase [Candidatus Bathyarchaeia archaeon]
MPKDGGIEDYALSLLSDLIAIPSVNPPGEKYDEICRRIESALKELGFKTRIVEGVKGKPNLIGTLGEGRPTLLFNGHVDVVPPGMGWETDPFKAVEKEGRIYGRGTSDMKGALAAMIAAVKKISDEGVALKGSLIFTATVDEETGGLDGLGYLVRKEGLRADYCLSGEPTRLNVCRCEKGVYWSKISVRGKAAHGSTPERGINAIEKMAKIISALQSIRFEKVHKILGRPTINIGVISGGTKINIVPDYCEILVDRRMLPAEDPSEVKGEIESALKAVKAQDPLVDYRIEDLLFADPFELPEDAPLVKMAVSAVEEALGRRPDITGLTGFTDARFTAVDAKIPSVLVGPGNIAQAHTANEFVEKKQILDAISVYATFLKRLLA